MSYCNMEEEFLSIYTSVKLIRGGKPVITKEELNNARETFMRSVYSTDNVLKPLAGLNFDNLEEIKNRFQIKASKNRSWLQDCFVYDDGKLYPTYSFFDITQTSYGSFHSFLFDDRYNLIVPEPIICGEDVNFDTNHLPQAKRLANYLTKYFAEKYIDMEVERGRWPKHLTNISYIFEKDLGQTLELWGTKQYFEDFNSYLTSSIAVLLAENNGKLVVSDKKYGNLKYNNLKRMLVGNHLFNICTSVYNEGESKFDIVVDGSDIKCNKQTLIDSDPYDNFSDSYSNEETTL